MPKMTKKFWNIMKNEEAKSADIVMYGTIGSDEYWDDVCDKTIKEEIGNLGAVENINVHINSPGGSVFAAVAIALTVNMKCFEIYFLLLYFSILLINRKHEMF